MIKMDEKTLQFVFDSILPYLPEGWKHVVFYAEYAQGSYSMRFYSECGDKHYTDCFSLPGASRTTLMKAFIDIDKALAESRKENHWTVFTLSVASDGKMQTDLDYTNHSEDMISFKAKWENKYLT